jgi:hypothetical protein
LGWAMRSRTLAYVMKTSRVTVRIAGASDSVKSLIASFHIL